MDIRGIGQKTYLPEDPRSSIKKTVDTKSKDKIEISDKAKTLFKETTSVKDLSIVRSRIDTKFYDSPEVISKVADSILKEIL